MTARRIAALAIALSALIAFGKDLQPQPYYTDTVHLATRLLLDKHVRQRPDDYAAGLEWDNMISCRAWTNLINQFDISHSVFFQSDLDKFASMQTRIDDAMRAGDVSFVFEVYKVFAERYAERIDFATNLIEHGEFDFSVNEDYNWIRKKAPWPKTPAERDELWRKRIKNELLAQMIGRELVAEKAKLEEEKAAKKPKKSADEKKDKKSDGDDKEAKGDKDGDSEDKDAEKEPELTPKQNLLKRYQRYSQAFFTETDEESLLQRYLSAVAQAYDPHSDYMSPSSKEEFDMAMNLTLCGVGAVLQMDDGALKVERVMPGGPMAKDGRIKKGDKIIGVGQGNGPIEDILYKPMKKSIRKIRGPKGTKVVLEVMPASDSSGTRRRRITLVRDEIKLEDQAATGRVERVTLNGVTSVIGYVKFREFYGTMDKRPSDPKYRSCSQDINKYIGRFQEPGVEMDGFILDLRGNGGGSLREALLLTQLFCPDVVPVVQIREKSTLYVLPSFPDQPQFSCRKPMLVLIDRMSASASEIVAGALKDLGRAIVVGDHSTHGKGTVQTVMPMGDPKYGSMKITTARFYRINGSSTQEKGVEPDIFLPSVLDGLDTGESSLPNALPWTRIEPAHYRPVWDVQKYAPELARLSKERQAKSERFQRHLRAVNLFHESNERKTVPLEWNARMKLMREEREMREMDDTAALDDEETAEETALADSEEGKDAKDDVVLKEALNIIADLVRLTEGAEVPRPRQERMRLPAWLQAIGS